MHRSVAVAVCVALLAGCASTISVQNKVAYDFDGDYLASIFGTAQHQLVAGNALQCDPLKQTLYLRIRNGVASGYLRQDENYSFRAPVSNAGELKAVIPIDSFYRYKPDSLLPPSRLKLVFNASLAPGSLNGSFMVGDRRFDYRGCVTNAKLSVL